MDIEHPSPKRRKISDFFGVEKKDIALSSSTSDATLSTLDPENSSITPPINIKEQPVLAENDIARAVLYPGGPSKFPDGDKLHLFQQVVRPTGAPSSWPAELNRGGKTRRVTPFCFETYPWLTYSKHLDGLFCRLCVFFAPENVGASKLSARQLVKEPCRRFSRLTGQNGYLYEHNKVHYHAAAKLAAEEFRLRTSQPALAVDSQLSAALSRKKEDNREIIKSITEVILLCGRMGLPLRGHRDDGHLDPPASINDIVTDEGCFRSIIQLYSLANIKLFTHLSKAAANATYLSKTTQNELVSCMTTVIRREIAEEVSNAKIYSVIADETTYLSHKTQLSVSVRYIKNKVIVERFLEFLNPDSLSGVGLTIEILRVLERAGLDPTYLVGQGYDGAAAMSGAFNGVQAEIKRRCGNQAVYVHCASHALNLTLVKASEVPEIRNAFGVVGSLAKFFTSSAVRTKALEEAIKAMDDIPSKYRLTVPCQTRSMEKHEAIHTAYMLYSVVLNMLQDMSQGRSLASIDASSLLDSLTKPEFVIALTIMNTVMTVTKKLAVALQSGSHDLFSAINHVCTIKEQLQEWRNNEAQFQKIFEKAQTLYGEEPLHIPRIVGRQTNRNNVPATSPVEYYRCSIYLPFLDGIISQMDDRFGNHHATVLCGLLPQFARKLNFNAVKEGFMQ